MNTGEWLAKAATFLTAKGVPEARANAEFLMADALKAGRTELTLHSARVPTDKQQRVFWGHVERRAKRIPLAYLLGTQPFMGLDLKVTPEALIPRPETEELVAEAVGLLKVRQSEELHILELGTGTGCIAVALAASLPRAMVYATDISKTAIELARENAMAQHVDQRIRFINEDLFNEDARFKGWADLLISNPPYIPTKLIDTLQPEVLKEPKLALDGGKDGLDALRAIIKAAPRYLKPGGWLALEIGSDQRLAVLTLLEKAGFQGCYVRKDAQGLDRIAVAKRD